MEIKKFEEIVRLNDQSYFNTVINAVNDHVVRLSIMSEPYPWHYHPNSDETFIGVEGIVIIETQKEVVQLTPGSSVTIPKNTVHRTSPAGAQSVNITIEKADMETVYETLKS